MINWKDPNKEKPKEGDSVVALNFHWKARFPSSMEIIGGEVEYNNDGDRWRVQTMDDSGHGSWALDAEDVKAWCYASEFLPVFPKFLEIGSE